MTRPSFASRRGAILVCLVLVVLLMPVAYPLVILATDDDLYYWVAPVLSDFPLLLLIMLVAPDVWRRARRRELGTGTLLWLVLLVPLAASFLVHPSLQGAQTLFRQLGVVALAASVSGLTGRIEQNVWTGAVTLVALAESALALLQEQHGGPLGLRDLGEWPGGFNAFGESWAVRGTAPHHQVLSAIGLVGASVMLYRASRSTRPLVWLALAAVAIVPVGITYSRAAALALALGCLPLLRATLSGDRLARLALVALLLGAGIPALIWNSGWLYRGTNDPIGDKGRGDLVQQALAVIAEDPLFGAGTGRYRLVVQERFGATAQSTLPVHNVPLLVAAESGVPAGLVVLIALIVIGRRALAGGPFALSAYAILLPHLLIDIHPYIAVQGITLFGLWLGLLDLAHRTPIEVGRAAPMLRERHG